MIGKKFGKLTVLGNPTSGKFPGRYWDCKCECGKTVTVRGCHLSSKHTLSCGCSRKDFSDRPAFKQLYVNYHCQAQNRKLCFELTIEEFEKLTLGPCFYCGAFKTQKAVKRNSSYQYNGVDRYDNDKGYVVGNCVSCCATHNHMKSDMSHSAFVAACRSVIDHIKI